MRLIDFYFCNVANYRIEQSADYSDYDGNFQYPVFPYDSNNFWGLGISDEIPSLKALNDFFRNLKMLFIEENRIVVNYNMHLEMWRA